MPCRSFVGRRIAALATAVLAVTAGLTAATAHADDSRANLISVRAGSISVSTGNCKYTPIAVAWSIAPGWTVISAAADVHHWGAVVDSQDVSTNSNYFWCPFMNLGRFTFGPATQVDAYDDNVNSALFTDNTTGYFDARYSSGSFISVSRSGSKVSFATRASHYNLGTNTWVPFNSPQFQVQYKSGTSWVPLKNLTPVGGKAYWSYYTSTLRTYRMVTTSTTSVWGRPSATVYR